VAFFLEQKILKVDERDDSLSTPLHWACSKAALTTIHYLLAWGANINAIDHLGQTPLHLSAMLRRTSYSDYLIMKLI